MDKREPINNESIIVAMTWWAGAGFEISFRRFGYDQYCIEMTSLDGRKASSILPENHVEGNFIEVLIHLNERIKKQPKLVSDVQFPEFPPQQPKSIQRPCNDCTREEAING